MPLPKSHYNSAAKRLHRPGRKKETIFCICALAPLLLHWLIFFVYGNLNSVLLAFQRYDVASYSYKFLTGDRFFENFRRFFVDLFGGGNVTHYFGMGVLFHLVGIVIGLPVSIMCSFVIYKKLPMHGVFKVILYLPSIFSAMVVALLFKYFADKALPEIMFKLFNKEINGMFLDSRYNVPLLLFYSAFFAVPGSLLINLGTMSRTPAELIEYGKLEGMSLWKEFIHVTLPLMFPVLQVYCLGLFTGFFTAMGPLHAIYANDAPMNTQTFGYYMFVSVLGDGSSKSMYGYTSAANLMIGLISVPIVFGTKKLFDRLDPEAEF